MPQRPLTLINYDLWLIICDRQSSVHRYTAFSVSVIKYTLFQLQLTLLLAREDKTYLMHIFPIFLARISFYLLSWGIKCPWPYVISSGILNPLPLNNVFWKPMDDLIQILLLPRTQQVALGKEASKPLSLHLHYGAIKTDILPRLLCY